MKVSLTMGSVILENISENFGMVHPVKDFNLTVEDNLAISAEKRAGINLRLK